MSKYHALSNLSALMLAITSWFLTDYRGIVAVSMAIFFIGIGYICGAIHDLNKNKNG